MQFLAQKIEIGIVRRMQQTNRPRAAADLNAIALQHAMMVLTVNHEELPFR